MKPTEFKKGIGQVLLTHGYKKYGACYKKTSESVTVLVSFQKVFQSQWFLNVGIWLHGLSENPPDKIEKSHLYFRLERLAPLFREQILAAGDTKSIEQERAHRHFLELLNSSILEIIDELLDEKKLLKAFADGELSNGMIRGEAREYLQSFLI
jgi:Domain of unknown function (DUF4304)